MRKEVLIAIVAGVLFGVILAFGIWRANSALKEKSTSEQISPETTLPVTPIPNDFDIALAKPNEYDVITSSPTVISGVTQPDSWVIVSGNDEDFYLKSDETGKFDQEVELTGGVNQFIITSYNQEGKSVSENLLIVYSTELLK
jgi:hypothetical protein